MTVSPEHGKRYNTRDGQVTRLMSRQESSFMGDGCGLIWCPDGKYLYGEVSPLDLISEYIEPTAEPAWIEWHGGECPIKSYKTLVDCRLANSIVRRGIHGRQLRWSRDMAVDDLIAYRITENHEPADHPDMTQNRVPWGLLTHAEKAALREWAKAGKKVLLYSAFGWSESIGAMVGLELMPTFATIYRTVSPPVISETVHGVEIDGHTVTITLTRHDGKPISGTVEV